MYEMIKKYLNGPLDHLSLFIAMTIMVVGIFIGTLVILSTKGQRHINEIQQEMIQWEEDPTLREIHQKLDYLLEAQNVKNSHND